MSKQRRVASFGLIAMSLLVACTSSATSPSTASTSSSSAPPSGTLPAWYSQFGNGVQVSLQGTNVVLQTKDLPDHTSPY